MARPQNPRIVAELGRPETSQETADRKSASSRRHRENQTMLNLVIALVASLAVVLFIVLVVVRPDQPPAKSVDFAANAAQIQPTIDEPLAVPALPSGWSSNASTFETGADGVTVWYVGLLTPGGQYIGMKQGIEANPSWLATQLKNTIATGTRTVDGIRWDVYDQRDARDDRGNLAYAMTTTIGASTVVLFGTADDTEFEVLATAVAADLGEK